MPHADKDKKKRTHYARNFAILFFIIVAAMYIASSLNEAPKPAPMSANDFAIDHAIACGYERNGMRFVAITIHVRNFDNVTTFHFTSAKILFTKYTFENGTVFVMNAQRSDNNETFNALHESRFNFPLNIPESGLRITRIEFTVTVYVQEVTQPIVRTFIEDVAGIGC